MQLLSTLLYLFVHTLEVIGRILEFMPSLAFRTTRRLISVISKRIRAIYRKGLQLAEKVRKKSLLISKKAVRSLQKKVGISIQFLKKNSQLAYIVLGVVAAVILYKSVVDLPDIESLPSYRPSAVQIYDRSTTLLYGDSSEADEKVSHETTPSLMIDSALLDTNVDIFSNRKLGLSALLVRQSIKEENRSVIEKVKQLATTLKVALTSDEKEVVERYFNNLVFEQKSVGIGTAARRYFGKELAVLTEKELLALVLLSQYSYEELSKNGGQLEATLDKLQQEKKITAARKDEINKQPLSLLPQTEYRRAPLFVSYILDEFNREHRDLLSPSSRLRVYTTLDLSLQNTSQQLLVEQQLMDQKRNGAAVIVNPKNGDLLTMISSVRYSDDEAQGQAVKVIAEYNKFAAENSLLKVSPITKITDDEGKELYKKVADRPVEEGSLAEVVEGDTAFILSDGLLVGTWVNSGPDAASIIRDQLAVNAVNSY